MVKQFSFLYILLIFQLGFAQSDKISKTDISQLLSKSRNCLLNLECDKSLNFAKKALNYAYKIGDNELIAKSYNLIGANFEEFSDFKKAIVFYEKGLEYGNSTTNDTLKDWIHGNLGNVYCYQKIDFKKGIEHYKKALAYSKKIKSEDEIMYGNLNMATAYFEIEDFKTGMQYLESSKSAALKTEDLETKIIFNSLLGFYYTHIKQFDKAEQFYTIALEYSKAAKPDFLDRNVMKLYSEVSTMYLKNKDFEKAYFYLDKYGKLRDEFYNEDRTKTIKTAGLHIQLDEYKREIGKMEMDRNIQSQNLKYSKIVVFLFVIIFMFLLLLLYTFYKNNKFKNQVNLDLAFANSELNDAKERAEVATQLKSQFVSTISHELRTPLYGVVGITNMIVDEHKELANSPYLNSLKYSAKYLLSLVNDVLQINKIEENKIILEETAFNVSDEITSISNSLQFIAAKNKNKIKFEIDPEIPEYLIGDKIRLSQIFMNLVSNALKFTKKGEVLISADLVRVEGKTNFIEFKVKDSGVGIAKEDQDKIFEKFVQVGKKAEDYQGTGLGLSIVKKLVELFGSEIFLESIKGEGTTFSFTIGFEVDNDKTNMLINDLVVDLSSSQIFNVLVVEDNKINQMVTKKILDNNGFKSQIVDDGLIAIKLLKKETFDVILMDINMPIINGFETAIKIRKLGITTPIIALTAFTKEEVIEEVMDSGMNDIIVKPFDSLKLFKTISNQINKYKNADV